MSTEPGTKARTLSELMIEANRLASELEALGQGDWMELSEPSADLIAIAQIFAALAMNMSDRLRRTFPLSALEVQRLQRTARALNELRNPSELFDALLLGRDWPEAQEEPPR